MTLTSPLSFLYRNITSIGKDVTSHIKYCVRMISITKYLEKMAPMISLSKKLQNLNICHSCILRFKLKHLQWKYVAQHKMLVGIPSWLDKMRWYRLKANETSQGNQLTKRNKRRWCRIEANEPSRMYQLPQRNKLDANKTSRTMHKP